MQQTVKILSCNADGTAQVACLRQSACSGDCHKCSGCGAVEQTMIFTARNPIGARVGEMVIVESESGPVLKAAAVLYMLPLVLFFLGYILGMMAWGKGGLAGCLAFVLGIALAVVYDRKVAAKNKTVYTITGFAGKTLESKKKGNYDLD